MSGDSVIPSVLYHRSKNLKRRIDQCHNSVTVQFYLVSKGKCILEHQGVPTQKKWRERTRLNLALFSFLCFFLLPLNLPCVIWARQEGCSLLLRLSLWSSGLPLFYFCEFSLLCLLATTILDSFFLFYLTNSIKIKLCRPKYICWLNLASWPYSVYLENTQKFLKLLRGLQGRQHPCKLVWFLQCVMRVSLSCFLILKFQ